MFKNGRLPAVAALSAAASSAVSTAGSTIFFRAGFIDVDGAAIQVAAIQLGNRTIAFGIVAHLHESEPSGLASVAVGDDADAIDGSVGFKQGSDGIFGGAEAQISNKYIFQVNYLSAVAEQ
jgi:hypothetical protein